MATDRPLDKNVSLRGADQISLDQLIAATSTSVLRALKEHELTQQGPYVNPRIWVGIWVDLERFRSVGGPAAGPGLDPAGAGRVG